MTLDERVAAAEREMKEAFLQHRAECDRICREQKKALGSEYRIDDPRNRPPFKEARKEFWRQVKVIGEKYNLPPETKLNI